MRARLLWKSYIRVQEESMRRIICLALGFVVLPLLTLSTSTAPMGFSLAYWAHKLSTEGVEKR